MLVVYIAKLGIVLVWNTACIAGHVHTIQHSDPPLCVKVEREMKAKKNMCKPSTKVIISQSHVAAHSTCIYVNRIRWFAENMKS